MNLDITWCTGLRCDKKERCNRNIERLIKEVVGDISRYDIIPYSIAQFADHEGKCDMFVEKEKEE
jgi:hypothetical protein